MINFLRKHEILKLLNFSKSTLHNKINSSVFPPPVKLGERAVAWPSYEIDALIKAYIAGQPVDEIRKLVQVLLSQRHDATGGSDE